MNQPFDQIAHTYDFNNDLMSFGFHRVWKRKLLGDFRKAQKLGSGLRVLDVATGTGELGDRIKRMDPSATVVGIDPSLPMLRQGQKMGRILDQWVVAEAEEVPFPNQSFDSVVCAYGVRNFRDRQRAFCEWCRILKPGGSLHVLEIHEPQSLLLAKIWKSWIPALAGVLSNRKNYEYLAQSTQGFPSPEELALEIESRGFHLERLRGLWFGGMLNLSTFVATHHHR